MLSRQVRTSGLSCEAKLVAAVIAAEMVNKLEAFERKVGKKDTIRAASVGSTQATRVEGSARLFSS